MRWLELSLEVEPELVETVQDLFLRFGGSGTAFDQPILPNHDPESYTIDSARPVIVRTYLPCDETLERKRAEIARGVALLNLIRPFPALGERVVDEEEWKDAWKPFFPVIRIGKRLVVKPSWRGHTPQADDIVIELDPGMAFGTGLHPSTRLCMEALEAKCAPGATVLDLGTGSGILALAAAGLGAARVLAVDTDSTAVEVAAANVKANQREAVVTVLQGGLPLPTPWDRTIFDLVAANINADTLVRLAPVLRQAVAPRGTLIGGGILTERLAEVTQALHAAGFRVLDRLTEADWEAVVAAPEEK